MRNVRLTTCRLKLPNILYLLTKFVHGRLSDFLSPLHLPRSLDIPISISFLALSKVRARSLEFFWRDRNETVLFQMYIDLISQRFPCAFVKVGRLKNDQSFRIKLLEEQKGQGIFLYSLGKKRQAM